MRKSYLARILFLTASALIPSCVAASDDPSANDPRVGDTESELTAGDEAADSRELGATDGAANGFDATTFGMWDCNPDRLCLWRGMNFQGEKLELVPFGQCQHLGIYGFVRATSSWFNRWSGPWTLYTEGNCTGARFQTTGGQSAATMSAYWDNAISGICYGYNCP
jgi:hypothetical protein